MHHLLVALEDERARSASSPASRRRIPTRAPRCSSTSWLSTRTRGNRGSAGRSSTALAELARERGCYGMWVLDRRRQPGGAEGAYEAAGGTRRVAGRACCSTGSSNLTFHAHRAFYRREAAALSAVAGPALRRALRFLAASVGPVDAEDAFQETFLSALRAYPSCVTPPTCARGCSRSRTERRSRAPRPG